MRIKHLLITASILFLKLNVFAMCTPIFTMDINGQGDTVCVGVGVLFTNVSTLNGDPISVSDWEWGDATPNESGIEVTHAFSVQGTYTVRLSTASANNCTGGVQVSHTVTVIAAPGLQGGSVDQRCYGICDGAASVFIFGPHTNYNILWSDNQNTEIAVGLCEGIYSVTVSDNYGCSTIASNYVITEPDTLIADATSDFSICPGDAPFKIHGSASGGTGVITYSWLPATDLDDPTADHPILTPSDTSYGIITLRVTDENGCQSIDEVEVSKVPAKISGTVYKGTTNTFPLQSGFVYLIEAGADDMQWRYIDTAEIQSNGTYFFDEVPITKVIILAKQTGSLAVMPGYYGDAVSWEDAFEITLTCADWLLNKNIHCMVPETQTETCKFKGTVYLVTNGKTQSEDPIPLIDVIVKKTPPGNAIAYTQTGDGTDIELEEGQFMFEHMPALPGVEYSFVLNFPGLQMYDNHLLEVAANDSLHGNLNFYVDTTPGTGGIWINNPLGVEVIKYTQAEMNAYPNPFSDQCELRFSNPTNSMFSFDLFDVTGKLIIHDEELRGNTFTVKTTALEQGMYIAEVRTPEKTFRTRILKE